MLGELEQSSFSPSSARGRRVRRSRPRRDSAARRADLTFGTIYKTLSRLEDKGLVESYVGEPTAQARRTAHALLYRHRAGMRRCKRRSRRFGAWPPVSTSDSSPHDARLRSGCSSVFCRPNQREGHRRSHRAVTGRRAVASPAKRWPRSWTCARAATQETNSCRRSCPTFASRSPVAALARLHRVPPHARPLDRRHDGDLQRVDPVLLRPCPIRIPSASCSCGSAARRRARQPRVRDVPRLRRRPKTIESAAAVGRLGADALGWGQP